MKREAGTSRRRFLKQTFAFSAAAALTGCTQSVTELAGKSSAIALNEPVSHLLMVGDWGWDGSSAEQSAVSGAMAKYAQDEKLKVDALLMLGDNFYGPLKDGWKSVRIKTQFEDAYPSTVFECPAYAVAGNHDYQVWPSSKVQAELEYAEKAKSRWTMPGLYYTFNFPEKNPVIRFLALDSNMPDEPAQPIPPDSSYYTMTAAEAEAQLEWVRQELTTASTTPFTAVMAHHPVYSNGPHGDNHTLIGNWDPLLKKHGVHMYFGGHDHDLQHLEFAGHPTSFVLSGGGGAPLVGLNSAPSAHGPFGREAFGFTHLEAKASLLTVRHIGTDGAVVHAFTKKPDGTVTILT